MNLETLSSFALARMLNDCAEGSAMQRAIQKEIRNREEQYKDIPASEAGPWLFPAPPKATQDKKY
jgi:FPC/CPF motif-containing protein YcgG